MGRTTPPTALWNIPAGKFAQAYHFRMSDEYKGERLFNGRSDEEIARIKEIMDRRLWEELGDTYTLPLEIPTEINNVYDEMLDGYDDSVMENGRHVDVPTFDPPLRYLAAIDPNIRAPCDEYIVLDSGSFTDDAPAGVSIEETFVNNQMQFFEVYPPDTPLLMRQPAILPVCECDQQCGAVGDPRFADDDYDYWRCQCVEDEGCISMHCGNNQ